MSKTIGTDAVDMDDMVTTNGIDQTFSLSIAFPDIATETRPTRALTKTTWTGAAGSQDWATAGNWAGDAVPGATSEVVIALGSVTASASIGTVYSIDLTSSLDFEATGVDTVMTSFLNSGYLTVDQFGGGSSLKIGATLMNQGTIDIGETALKTASTVTTSTLTNSDDGIFGTINISGGSAAQATLDVAANAGFGTAGVLVGSVNLSGDALLEFGGGQITSIASRSELSLNGKNAVVADSTAPTTNSALKGLATVQGSLNLSNGSSVATTGSLANTGSINLDQVDASGGSSLKISGLLSNGGTISIGNADLSGASTITSTGLTNVAMGTFGTIDITGSSTTKATLDVAAVAGFGAVGDLIGDVNLTGDALLEFAGGKITFIESGSELTLDGQNAVVAAAAALTSNSALTGLATIYGALNLENGASVSTSGAVANIGDINLDQTLGSGGASLKIDGVLTNGGTISIGNTGLTSASKLTVLALSNVDDGILGTINLTGTAAQAELDVAGSAGFGTAGVLMGNVNLSGNALLEFAGGEIAVIAANSELSLTGAQAVVADAAHPLGNSALTGLASNSGRLNLNGGASVTTSGSLTNMGFLNLDQAYGSGGSSMTINGVLTNGGTVAIGGSTLSAASTLTVAALNDAYGSTLGTIYVSGGPTAQATLDVASAAGFGTAGVLVGSVSVSGDGLVEFASGQITTIAYNGGLTLVGNDAFVADMTKPFSNSALEGLSSNAGALNLGFGASVSTTGAFRNVGSINLDQGYYAGGSSLTIAGALTNGGALDIGNILLSGASTVTVGGLNDAYGNTLGTINLTGATGKYSPRATLNVAGVAGFGTAGILTGSVNLSGNALLDFTTGKITAIASFSSLTLNGNFAFIANATSLTTNSALTSLTSIAGRLDLESSAALTTSGSMTNTGAIILDQNFNGGGALTLGGALTNGGTVDIGNSSLVAGVTMTTKGLTNVYGGFLGTINVSGSAGSEATFVVNAVAGFGTAGVLLGDVNISDDSLMEFASGEIFSIAAQSELTLSGGHAFLADASATASNSALTGLTTNSGSLTLEVGASLRTTGALMETGNLNLEYGASLTLGGALTNYGQLQLDSGYLAGGSTLNVGGALINGGSVSIGASWLQTGSSVIATALTNTGTVTVFGGTSSLATLDVTGAAGFGALGVLSGNVNLYGDALLEFGGGEISSIAGNSELTLNGDSAFVADATATTGNSALIGLSSNAGLLNLADGASVTTNMGLANSGYVSLDQNGGYSASGGSNLKVGGLLTNNGVVVVGNTSITAGDSLTTSGLTNTGTVDVYGALAALSTIDVTSGAGFGSKGVLTGGVSLAGDALLEFSGGEITTIASSGGLTLSGADALIADAGATTTNSALTGLSLIDGGLTLENGASIATGAALTNYGSVYVGPDLFALGSQLKVGGVLTNDGTLGIGNTFSAVASSVSATGLVNNGTINLDGGFGVYSQLTVGSVANDGGINLFGESETFAGAITGVGSFSLASGSTLGFGSSVALGENVTFNGADELQLGAATKFAGSISSFGLDDSIDVTTLGSGTKLAFSENSFGTLGVLKLTDGSLVADLTFVGNYGVGDFSIGSDGGKGSLIKFV